jgi:transcriptional regulator with XRE-family HTH domain
MAIAIGKVIRIKRLAQGLSQEQFADLAGVHRTQAGFLERGERTPSVFTVAQAARALKMLASDLLREAGF